MGLHESTLLYVDKKLISHSKKELENFIWAKFEDYNRGRAPQKALRTAPLVRNQGPVLYVFLRQRAVHQMMYYWQLAQPRSKRLCGGSWDPLRDQEGILCQGVVLLMLGECCSLWLSRYSAHGGGLAWSRVVSLCRGLRQDFSSWPEIEVRSWH